MENYDGGKFKVGDRIVVTSTERWCYGCHGTVKGAWKLPKGSPYYLITLDDSPSAYIGDSWVYEFDLEAEEKEVRRGQTCGPD